MKKGEIAPEATLEASQVKPVVENVDDVEKQIPDRYGKFMQDLVNLSVPPPKSDVASMNNVPTKDAELLVPPPRSALSSVRVHSKVNPHLPLPPAPLSTVPSVLEAAAPGAPTQDGHAIAIQILTVARFSDLSSSLELAPGRQF